MRLLNNRFTRRVGVPATIAAAAVALTAGVAVAAMLIFGQGTFSADAAQTHDLTVDNTALTGTLYPGATVGAKGIVHNPNDFPVKVTAVVVASDGMQASSNASPDVCNQHVTLVGGTTGNTFGPHSDVAGRKYAVTPAVTVGAGGAAWVEIPGVVAQDVNGTSTCGVKATIYVEGTAGA